jgi:hypothetical protein
VPVVRNLQAGKPVLLPGSESPMLLTQATDGRFWTLLFDEAFSLVIPAKAGIQCFQRVLDPGLRRGDGRYPMNQPKFLAPGINIPHKYLSHLQGCLCSVQH